MSIKRALDGCINCVCKIGIMTGSRRVDHAKPVGLSTVCCIKSTNNCMNTIQYWGDCIN